MEFNEKAIAEYAYSRYKPAKNGSKIHPWEHILRVVRYAKILAKMYCPEHINAVIIGAYFHDIGRDEDEGGDLHAKKGAYITSEIFKRDILKIFPFLEANSVLFAIKYHADERAPNSGPPVVDNYKEIKQKGLNKEIIACLWDADRLDLARVRQLRPIKKEFFSTDFAKKYANTKDHYNLYSDRNTIDLI